MSAMRPRHRSLAHPLVAILLLASASIAGASTTDIPLLQGYLQLNLAQEIPKQAATLTEGLSPADVSDIQRVSKDWMGERIAGIRTTLDGAYGDNARGRFEDFIGRFLAAEQNADSAFLAALAKQMRMEPDALPDFASLRRLVLQSQLQDDVKQASELLGELQTWADLRRRDTDNTPPLTAWLTRDEPAQAPPPAIRQTPRQPAQPDPPPRPVKPKAPANPLAAAEVPLGDFDADSMESVDPMDSYSAMRKEKMDRKLKEARAGMDQLARERAAFEQEAAAKELALAQAEAENMKRHAEKLAAAESEAIEQRKYTWGSRLKRVVGSATGAFGGAVLGGVGARAGEEAVNAIFD